MGHSRVSRNLGCLGRRNPPHPAWPKARPASPARGEAGCFIRLKCSCYPNFKEVFWLCWRSKQVFPEDHRGVIIKKGCNIFAEWRGLCVLPAEAGIPACSRVSGSFSNRDFSSFLDSRLCVNDR